MERRRGLAMRFLSARLSVGLSLCQRRGLWQNERKICADFYTIQKTIQPSFLGRRTVGGGDPFWLKLQCYASTYAAVRRRTFSHVDVRRGTSPCVDVRASTYGAVRSVKGFFCLSCAQRKHNGNMLAWTNILKQVY